MNWWDTFTLNIAPRWTARRIAWRVRAELLARHYEAAASGRRTEGWVRTSSDQNAAAGGSLGKTRDVARDLTRNNPYAEAAVATIADHTVGYGIVAKPVRTARAAQRNVATDRWRAWAESTACDADGRNDFAGLQKLVVRSIAESGEVLVRRRWRRPEDGLPIPLQLQVLEADYLDTLKDQNITNDGTVVRRVIQGVEFDAIGRRTGYWLFPEHPGSTMAVGLGSRIFISQRVPAEEILHVYRLTRPGQVRGVSWFAPVALRMKDFDEYEDAALVKQKVAACLAVLTSDPDGSATAIGEVQAATPELDRLSPGLIASVPAGRSITVVDPPSVSEHAAYSQTVLRGIAAGLGVTYEDVTGDYQSLPFSAARMSRLRHWAHVDDWRWRVVIPQFCDPVWRWAMEATQLATGVDVADLAAEWTCPPPPLIDPQAEALAAERMVRNGALTWPEMVRERGYDPETVLAEIVEWNAKFDAKGVVLDCDPRHTTQAGQAQGAGATQAQPSAFISTNGHG